MYMLTLVTLLAGLRDKSGDPRWCDRQQANQVLSRVTAHTILTHVALVFGIPIRGDGKANISRRIGRHLFRWCLDGFPHFCDGCEYRLLSQLHGLLLEWLFSDKLLTSRSDEDVWKVSCSLSCVLALHNFHSKHHDKPFLRVMLRAFAPSTQRALLTREFSTTLWHHYVAHIYASIFCPDDIPAQTSLYFCWIAQKREWYVGKTNVLRTSGTQHSGSVMRYKEHLSGFLRQNKFYGHFRRYQAWKNCAPKDFMFVPAVWGGEQQVLRYEAYLY